MPEPLHPDQQGTSPGSTSQPGLDIPNHALVRLIARGSYGEVWLARNDLGALRAVKIVFESTFRDKRPFERELAGVQKFEPVSRLHEGLVDILQVGRNPAGGYFYYVMELADDARRGPVIEAADYVPRTLAQETATTKRVPIENCIEIGLAIASALKFLHSKGLIHRDVKPSNIVVVNGVLKLADIGLVTEMSEARSYVGTEGFIPPEGPGTIQADLYSLGKVLYELSTGKDRHDYPELPTLLDQTAHAKELLEFNKIVLRACRAEPRQRYQSADELITDLQRLQRGEPVVRRKFSKRQWMVGAPVAAIIVIIGVLLALFAHSYHPSHLTSMAAGSQAGFVSAPPGLVSWWPAEGNAGDLCGKNPGIAINGVTFVRGKVGRAFALNGLDQWIVVSNAPSLNPTEELSLAAWVCPAELPVLEPGKDGQEIAGKDGTISNRQYLLTLDVRQVFSAHVAVAEKGYLQVYGGTRVVPNTWYHVAMTYDQNSLRLYVNGALDASRAWTGPVMTSDEPFRIGGGGPKGAPPFHFHGAVDEVALFSRALPESEIEALYEAGSHGKRPKQGF